MLEDDDNCSRLDNNEEHQFSHVINMLFERKKPAMNTTGFFYLVPIILAAAEFQFALQMLDILAKLSICLCPVFNCLVSMNDCTMVSATEM